MKKRSMLAIASLATGFVVAAITPSPAADHDVHGDPHVSHTLGTAEKGIGEGSAPDDEAPSQQ
ncbi:hypothetical protein ACFY0F_08235 [Streptomyces sp. NPDC001544]|uniref:hypothetical protein n=1 Tax=Streptomyces sp. NPDC001544 TaxID=3364584 RepID=UPI003679141B